MGVIALLVTSALLLLLSGASARIVRRSDDLHLDLSPTDDRRAIADAYIHLIESIREAAWEDLRQPNDDARHISVRLSAGQDSVVLHLRRSDLYLMGFTAGGVQYSVGGQLDPAFPQTDKNAVVFMDVGENYANLTRKSGKGIGAVILSEESCAQAIRDLARYGGRNKNFKLACRAILNMVVLISEAVRFEPVKERIAQALLSGESVRTDEPVLIGSEAQVPLFRFFNEWSSLSGQLLLESSPWSFMGFSFADPRILQWILGLPSFACARAMGRGRGRGTRDLHLSPDRPGGPCGHHNAFDGGLKLIEALLPQPGHDDVVFAFQENQFALVDLFYDTALSSSRRFWHDWPFLSDAGFPFVDAFLPSANGTETLVFSGNLVLHITWRLNGGPPGVSGPWTLDGYMPALARAGFDRVDAALRSPVNPDHAYFFRGERYALYSLREDRVVVGPLATRSEWGVDAVDAAIPVHGAGPARPPGGILFRGDAMYRVGLRPGPYPMGLASRGRISERKCFRDVGLAMPEDAVVSAYRGEVSGDGGSEVSGSVSRASAGTALEFVLLGGGSEVSGGDVSGASGRSQGSGGSEVGLVSEARTDGSQVSGGVSRASAGTAMEFDLLGGGSEVSGGDVSGASGHSQGSGGSEVGLVSEARTDGSQVSGGVSRASAGTAMEFDLLGGGSEVSGGDVSGASGPSQGSGGSEVGVVSEARTDGSQVSGGVSRVSAGTAMEFDLLGGGSEVSGGDVSGASGRSQGSGGSEVGLVSEARTDNSEVSGGSKVSGVSLEPTHDARRNYRFNDEHLRSEEDTFWDYY